MSKGILKRLKSARVILCMAITLAVVFLVHFMHVSIAPDEGSNDKKVIDMLRAKKIVFTKVAKEGATTAGLQDKSQSGNIAESERPTADHPVAAAPATFVEQHDAASTEAAAKSEDPISLPGGADHRILSLSDAQFRSIPVSEMFAWYGQALGGGSCAGDFGNDLITRWRDTKQSFCAPAQAGSSQPSEAASGGGNLDSAIDCYLVHQTRHHGAGDNLCLMRNVAVDLALFADDSKTRPVIQTYVDTRHGKQPYIKFPAGFIQGDCTPVPQLWKASAMPGWNADLTVTAFQQINHAPLSTSAAEGSAQVCAEWVEHPVLVTERDTFANFFHDSEDFFNVFIALAVLKWKPAEVQMYLTDLYPQGPFWEMWSKVFSQGNEDVTKPGAMTAMTAWDLRQRFKDTPPGKKVCFRNLAIGIYGPAAPMTVASWDTPCKRTALVRAYSDYVIRGLQLQGRTHYARAAASDTVVVTYMARRPSKEWPEKKYCDSKNSFFLCELWQNFGERRLGRMIHNDAEVVAALKGLQGQRIGSAKTIIVQDVDYNILSFEEQIATDLATDVMIGPHGAGLMHNIFMRDRAALIELFVDGSSVNRHFHNLAHWFGRDYRGVSTSNPVRIPELLQIVTEAIRNIDVTKY